MTTFDCLPDGTTELEALLRESGAAFQREAEGRFRLLLCAHGCKWQTICDCQDNLVLFYGLHPARVSDPLSALQLCSQLNRIVAQGAFFVEQDHILFRTHAELTEFWNARDTLVRALEYNAAVLAHFWARLAAGSEGFHSDFPKNTGP